jgi:hypothetical protein
MTKEEILSHFETKTIEKILRREFPFVKGLSLDDKYEDYASHHFMDVLIDPNELANYTGFKLRGFMIEKEGELVNYLSSLVTNSQEKDVMVDLQDRIFEVFNSVHGSNAIPSTMKMKKKPRSVSFRTTSPYQS